MKKVDYGLLQEDVKFPLKWDHDEYKRYIFDSDNEMIMVAYRYLPPEMRKDCPFEKLIGGMKEIKVLESRPHYTLYQGDFYVEGEEEPIGCVRGWGRLQYKDRPEERQDNIAAYILNVINNL